MQIAIVGLGNIGSVYAAHLAAAGAHRVFACVRNAPGPLAVEGSFGKVTGEIEWFNRPEQVPRADWVFIAVKTYQSRTAAAWLPYLLANDSRLLILQNGVDAAERWQPAHPSGVVLPTVIYTNSKKLGDGHFRHLRPEYDLAVPPGDPSRELIEVFRGTAIRVEQEPEFLTAAWRKFLVNLAANPLTALVGHGIGALRSPEMEELAVQLLDEAAAVGRAEGAKLEAGIAKEVLQWMKGFPADTGTSMLEDRQAGRALEWDALTGTAVRLGRKHGVAMPVNQMVLALLRASDPAGNPAA